jgi:hypothetical protein
MPLTVTTNEGPGHVTIRAVGSLDSNTYTILEEHVTAARARVIVATQRAMKATGGSMALTNLQPQIRKVFEIIMALPSLNVFEDDAELDRYLAAMQKKVREEGGAR